MIYVSNTYAVQVQPALQRYVSNTFPVQVVADTVTSNTFSLTISPPEGMQVIELTSIDVHSPVAGILDIGDEWVVDQFTDGGVAITILPDGTYSTPDITGLGNQIFNWYSIDVDAGYAVRSSRTETIIDPATVDIPPSISVHPINNTLTEGSTEFITFSVVATAKPDPTYQWQLNGINIPGATGPSLDVYGSQVSIANNGDTYRVIVSSTLGSVNSLSAVLAVEAQALPPVITLHPVDQTVNEGSGSVTYTVSASSVNPISIQWEVFNGATFEDVIGETGESITILGAGVTYAENNGNGYRARISNTEGTVYSSIAALFVTPLVDEAPDAVLTATEILDTSLNVRFTADESGTFKLVVVSNNSSAPTVEQVLNDTAPGLLRSSPEAFMTAGVEVITPIVGLAVYTPYDVYAVLSDIEGNTRLLDRLDILTARDSTKPTIQLVGSANIYLPVGRVFTDPGAILTDNEDPDRPILGSGTILHNIPGIYVRTYNGTDIEGNVADQVTRTIIVYDPALLDSEGGVVTDVIDEVIEDPIDTILD
jgi:hypothetical protein